jgi:siroheme synthase
MGIATLAETARRLVEAGRSPSTPVAVISRATLPDERVVVGDLATIAEAVEKAALETPALVVVGDVVARRVTPSAPQRREDRGTSGHLRVSRG